MFITNDKKKQKCLTWARFESRQTARFHLYWLEYLKLSKQLFYTVIFKKMIIIIAQNIEYYNKNSTYVYVNK